jgi:hypothetical protein
MRFGIVVLFLFAHASFAWPRSIPVATANPPQALKTFTSPDGSFQFSYPNSLVVCERKQNESDAPFYWVPTENCMAYHPVCDGVTPQKYKVLTCLAFRRDESTKTPAFEAGTFSIEIVEEAATAKSCLAKPEYDTFTLRAPIQVKGISFTVFEFAEAGMSQNVSGALYRAFHSGKCYQLGIDVAQSSANDPPFDRMTKQELDRVNHALEQARDSFRFFK